MPALPSPESGFSWRRAAANRLRVVAAWLDRGPARGSDARPGTSEASASASVWASASASEPVSVESSTAVRGLNVEGAPEHWVQLLRDAGLVPPAAPTNTPPVARPTLRALGRSWRAKQAPQHTPGTTPLVAGPDTRASTPTWDAEQAPQHTLSTTPHVAGPDMRASRPTERAEQAPQRTPSLRLRTSRTEAPPVAGPDMRATRPTWDAEQAPQRTPSLRPRTTRTEAPPVAGPDMRASRPTESAEQAPQHAHHTQHPAHTPEPQGKPSRTESHTPAPALKGNWPELAQRPMPSASTTNPATTPLTEALARQARLTDEQLAV
jgi:hypothetical protein